MKNSPHTDNAVVVLGDHNTGNRAEMLARKAAEHGATIAEVHTFDPGQPAGRDDLTQIEPVVHALTRALATGNDIWVPFWREDLAREEHLRRISLVLQRHGLNLLLGQDMWPFPRDGGISDIDVALRREVRAVDDLDHAALAAAALPTLSDEIAYSLCSAANRPVPPADHTDDRVSELLDLIEADFGPCPPLPATTAPWPRRRPSSSGSPASSSTNAA